MCGLNGGVAIPQLRLLVLDFFRGMLSDHVLPRAITLRICRHGQYTAIVMDGHYSNTGAYTIGDHQQQRCQEARVDVMKGVVSMVNRASGEFF